MSTLAKISLAALLVATVWAGPVNAADDLRATGKSEPGALLDACAGDNAKPDCLDSRGDARGVPPAATPDMPAQGQIAPDGSRSLGISPAMEPCRDRPGDLADPNCNRPDRPRTPSK